LDRLTFLNRHLGAANYILIFIISCCSAFFPGVVCASNLGSIKLEWQFKDDLQYVYRFDQNLDVQTEAFDDDKKTWKKSPIQKETTEGECVLTSLGDSNAHGVLFLRLLRITSNNLLKPIPSEQKETQKVAEFRITHNAVFDDYKGKDKETYLLLRLIFGIPPESQKVNEQKIYPFSFYTKGESADSAMTGSISHEMKGIEKIEETPCIHIETEIDLLSKSDNPEIPGKIIWKGKGSSYFNMEKERLQNATWKIAKKTEAASGEAKTPFKIIEISNLTIKYVPANTEAP
jgi:hypothetical protein